jgi:hypothetical protein
LRINDQPFFAPSRLLRLMTTACPSVLKLSWPVWHGVHDHHMRWLLWRLQVWTTAEQPWWWTSTNADYYRTPVRFRAWLVAPIGDERQASGTWYRTCFLHLHLAPDVSETPPQLCPSQCRHTRL